MKRSPMVPGLYVTFAALLGVTLLLLGLLARSKAGLQPVRGLPPFALDEPPPATGPSPR
jgi:hypothetical protein